MIAFSSYLLHRSGPNASKSDRWVHIAEYMSQEHYDPHVKPPYFMISQAGVSRPGMVLSFRGKRKFVNQMKYLRQNEFIRRWARPAKTFVKRIIQG